FRGAVGVVHPQGQVGLGHGLVLGRSAQVRPRLPLSGLRTAAGVGAYPLVQQFRNLAAASVMPA
ncbi:hypothetical protein, partial [Polaromonas sp. AET17H-212]|uniref:hypothetical protein n=1 Tax=Polaromonas sp. AET17H-212 TaxID=1977061 RepID=UPI001C3F09B6